VLLAIWLIVVSSPKAIDSLSDDVAKVIPFSSLNPEAATA
jgi:hypothetical protein